MSKQAEIIANLTKIAGFANPAVYGYPDQAIQIDEAIGYLRRLWHLANAVEELPVGPRDEVRRQLTGIADRCEALENFRPNDQGHLRAAVEYFVNLQYIASGGVSDEPIADGTDSKSPGS